MFDLHQEGVMNLHLATHRQAADLLCARIALDQALDVEPATQDELEQPTELWPQDQQTAWDNWQRQVLAPARDRWWHASQAWTAKQWAAPTVEPIPAAYWVLFGRLPDPMATQDRDLYVRQLLRTFAWLYAGQSHPELAR